MHFNMHVQAAKEFAMQLQDNSECCIWTNEAYTCVCIAAVVVILAHESLAEV